MDKARPAVPWWIFLAFPVGIALLYFPVLYLIAFSFLEKVDTGLQFTLKWYQQVMADEQIRDAAFRSLKLAFATGIGSSLLGLLAAVSIHKTHFRAKQVIHQLSMISLLLPELVIGLSLLIWFHMLGFNLGFFTVLIAHISFTLSFSFFAMSARIAEIEDYLVEAAQDLGSYDWSIFFKVILPLMVPSLLASWVLSFILSFDDFLITFFTNGVGMDTLPIKLYSSMRAGHSPKVNALASCLILFSVFIIWFFSRFFKFHKYLTK